MFMQIDPDFYREHASVAEAARLFGVDRQAVRKMIHQERLPFAAAKAYGRWWLPRLPLLHFALTYTPWQRAAHLPGEEG